MDYSYVFLFTSFVLAIAVIYLSIMMIQKFHVTFSPKEMAFFGLIMFAVGWVVSSYLLGNALQILEGSAVVVIVFALFVRRWNKRRLIQKGKSEAGVL